MSVQVLTELTTKLADVRTATARVSAIPSMLEDKRLQFGVLVRLVQANVLDASVEATSSIGKGYTCSGPVERLRHIIEDIGQRAPTQYGGDEVLLAKLAQEDLLQLLPNVVAASQSTIELLSQVGATLDNLITKAIRQATRSDVTPTNIYDYFWEDLQTQANVTLYLNGFSFKGSRTSALVSVLSNQSMLAYVSLCRCAITDIMFAEIIPSLEGLEHLRVLDVSDNALTEASSGLLQTRLASGDTFRRLERLELQGNLFLEDVTARVQKALDSKGSGGPTHKLNALVLEGVGMEAAVLAKSLKGLPASVLVDAKVDLVSASSFASIVAVALAAGIDSERINAFFDTVAVTVFGGLDYSATYGYFETPGNGVLSAARWARRWYSGGSYYNWTALVEALHTLFGAEILSLTLSAFGASYSTAPRMMLAARGTSSGSLKVFRTYQDLPHGQRTPEEAGNSSTVTILEALEACCTIPGYFAPKNTSIGLKYVDCMSSSLDLCLSEAVQRARRVSEVRVCLMVPERQAAAVPPLDTVLEAELLIRKVLASSRAADASAKLGAQGMVGAYFTSLGPEHLPAHHILPDQRKRASNWMRITALRLLSGPNTKDQSCFSLLPVIHPKLSTPTLVSVNERDKEILSGTSTVALSLVDIRRCFDKGAN